MRNPQTVSAGQLHIDIQPAVEGHLMGVGHPGPITSVHTNFGVGTSEDLDSIVVGNREELKGNDEISTICIWIRENHIIKTTLCQYLFLLENCKRPWIGSRT